MKLVQKLALIGLCSIAPAYLQAQDPSSSSGQNEAQSGQMQMHEHGMMHSQVTAQVPTDLNRATKLVGTDIVNQQNQKLGTIRDLVVDPKSQRVAYAWVEKSSESGNTGKYVAVPLNLFTPSTDQKNLVLNADKNRFDSAQGYARNQMPNMAIPASQISFWHSITEAAGAQPGMDQNYEPQGAQRSSNPEGRQ